MTMKKVLFATTALIATASMAAADVRVSGYGRFGLSYQENADLIALPNGTFGAANGRSETNLTTRLRLQFDMSAEADNGVTFGARVRAESENRNNSGPGTSFAGGSAIVSSPRMWVTYEGFTLSVGNILGAMDNVPGLYLVQTKSFGTGIDGMGFNSLVMNVNGESFNWDSFSSKGAGANGVEILYTAGGFTGQISYSADNGTPLLPNQLSRAAAMAAYTFGDWTVAIAAQDSELPFEDKVFVSASGDIGDFGVRIAYADNDGIGKWGLYGSMNIGAASDVVIWVTDEEDVDAADVAAGRADNRDASVGGVCATTCNGLEGTSFGINYGYDLGGGAAFQAGYVHRSDSIDMFQAGVFFAF
jgi:outer membrane protein OmpU